MDKPIINLWRFDGIGLIIAHQSGVSYSNETGGYDSLFPEYEGVFVPLKDPLMNQQEMLERYFIDAKRKERFCKNIDEETADFIDRVLALSYLSKRLKVNREKLADSHEAWIHVVILADERDEYLQEFCRFPSSYGVLTWENSD